MSLDATMMIFTLVYVLRLEDDCYYVGITTNLNLRYCQHVTGRGGSKWTRLHKPIEIVSVVVGDNTRENEITRELMRTHGWENVRGGPYCRVEMKQPGFLR